MDVDALLCRPVLAALGRARAGARDRVALVEVERDGFDAVGEARARGGRRLGRLEPDGDGELLVQTPGPARLLRGSLALGARLHRGLVRALPRRARLEHLHERAQHGRPALPRGVVEREDFLRGEAGVRRALGAEQEARDHVVVIGGPDARARERRAQGRERGSGAVEIVKSLAHEPLEVVDDAHRLYLERRRALLERLRRRILGEVRPLRAKQRVTRGVALLGPRRGDDARHGGTRRGGRHPARRGRRGASASAREPPRGRIVRQMRISRPDATTKNRPPRGPRWNRISNGSTVQKNRD